MNKTPEKELVTKIHGAGTEERREDRLQVWEDIQKGLVSNCRNYELYMRLGNYYLEENPDQSYLCYENALFYCDVPEGRQKIEQMLCRIKEQYPVLVKKTSIIILSYNLLEYTRLCLESIRRTTPESAREIVVVDNGSSDGSVEWLRAQKDIILVENTENMGFPAGCNQGILAGAEESDIFLLNNDTVLVANSLFWLRMGLYDQKENGAAGSVTNNARGQTVTDGIDDAAALTAFGEKTNTPMKRPYEVRLYLIGFAVLVKRSVVGQIGLLDERFSPGNSEDLDYGLRIIQSGYRNVLCKNSFILHFGSRSFKKDSGEYAALLWKNSRKLNEKWGFDVEQSTNWREDLIRLIDEPEEKLMRLLDVGCGCGALMARAKSIYPYAEVYGIEPVSEAAGFASSIGPVLCGDAEQSDFPWEEEFFDYIMVRDTLECLTTPENLLKKLQKYLKPNGHMIVSVPNMKHYSVLLPLLKRDEFSYRDAGILNKRHVRLYTGTEIQKLLSRSGCIIERSGYTIAGKPDDGTEAVIDRLSSLTENSEKESFTAYRYIVVASRPASV